MQIVPSADDWEQRDQYLCCFCLTPNESVKKSSGVQVIETKISWFWKGEDNQTKQTMSSRMRVYCNKMVGLLFV